MFLNKIGMKFGANDTRNINVMHNQDLQLDTLPMQSDCDPDSATKTGFLTGYHDLTGGSVLYQSVKTPIVNPAFTAKMDPTFVQTPMGSVINRMDRVPVVDDGDVTNPPPVYIQAVNAHRADILGRLLSQMDQSAFFNGVADCTY